MEQVLKLVIICLRLPARGKDLESFCLALLSL
jgi:hypothetical protein